VGEYGLVAPQQLPRLRTAIPNWLENAENGLSGLFRSLLQGLQNDLITLDQRVQELDKQIEQLAKDHEITMRLQQLRGVGPMIATALIATVGGAKHYKSSRQMAAALGLTPRQHHSGNKEHLLGISKRGDAYLRTLLIHVVRAVVARSKHKEDRLSQ
jgi:transposase